MADVHNHSKGNFPVFHEISGAGQGVEEALSIYVKRPGIAILEA